MMPLQPHSTTDSKRNFKMRHTGVNRSKLLLQIGFCDSGKDWPTKLEKLLRKRRWEKSAQSLLSTLPVRKWIFETFLRDHLAPIFRSRIALVEKVKTDKSHFLKYWHQFLFRFAELSQWKTWTSKAKGALFISYLFGNFQNLLSQLVRPPRPQAVVMPHGEARVDHMGKVSQIKYFLSLHANA